MKEGKQMSKRTLYGTVIVTYRCNARCNMCDCFKDPTKPSEEITLEEIKKLPEMAFTNVTGGEPFVRQDIPDIVRELYKKSDNMLFRGIFYGCADIYEDRRVESIFPFYHRFFYERDRN